MGEQFSYLSHGENQLSEFCGISNCSPVFAGAAHGSKNGNGDSIVKDILAEKLLGKNCGYNRVLHLADHIRQH